MPNEKLNLKLEGQDGNAFSLLGFFRREAEEAGWSKDEIEKTTEEAMSGDYDHLLQTLMSV